METKSHSGNGQSASPTGMAFNVSTVQVKTEDIWRLQRRDRDAKHEVARALAIMPWRRFEVHKQFVSGPKIPQIKVLVNRFFQGDYVVYMNQASLTLTTPMENDLVVELRGHDVGRTFSQVWNSITHNHLTYNIYTPAKEDAEREVVEVKANLKTLAGIIRKSPEEFSLQRYFDFRGVFGR